LQDLPYGGLPKYEDYYDSIKQINMLDIPYQQFVFAKSNECSNMTDEVVLKYLQFTEIPMPGKEVFANMERAWKESGIDSMFKLCEDYIEVSVNIFETQQHSRYRVTSNHFWTLP
jgi:hypothetical protein